MQPLWSSAKEKLSKGTGNEENEQQKIHLTILQLACTLHDNAQSFSEKKDKLSAFEDQKLAIVISHCDSPETEQWKTHQHIDEFAKIHKERNKAQGNFKKKKLTIRDLITW